jgi:hypothetical protein
MKRTTSTNEPVQGMFKQIAEMPTTYTFEKPLDEQAEKLATALLNKYPALEPKRVGRALELVQKHAVMHAKRNEVDQPIEPSNKLWIAAGKKGWYIINPAAKTCTCPDSANGHVCKHRIAVFLYMSFIPEYNRLIALPANRAQPTALNPERCEFCGQLLSTPFCPKGNPRHAAASKQVAKLEPGEMAHLVIQSESQEVQQFKKIVSKTRTEGHCPGCGYMSPKAPHPANCPYCGNKLPVIEFAEA